MNYYNPYFYTMPTNMIGNTAGTGLFSRLTGGSKISLGGILNGTQRVLSFANQAIPLVKQVRPMLGNAKTMFKVMNEFKKTETPSQRNNTTTNNSNISSSNSSNTNTEVIEEKTNNTVISSEDGPTFFI